jgi:DNA-binding SARP family transcriptional activator
LPANRASPQKDLAEFKFIAKEWGAITVRFRLLGPVGAYIEDRPVDVGSARQRCVLAALLVDINRHVPADQLVERVWGGGRLPDRPRSALQTYISLLRRALAPARDLEIVRQPGGYMVTADESLVDLHEFRGLARQARLADDALAVTLFESALALWTGEAFGSLDTPWLNELRVALGEERQAAELDLTDIQLRLGQHGTLLAQLSERADARPLDERLAGQLMLALFRAGRPADALRHYERVRRRLAGELGASPGRALQRLHQRILADDRDLYPHPSTMATASPQEVPPRQLPAAPRLFTGRSRELTLISEAIAEGRPGGATAVVAISGGGGIGKTWLALHWAHRNLDRFPDGQLYVDLRGFDPTGEPTPPASAIRGFLGALGVDRAAIPLDPDAQIGMYRSLIAHKRMLIVLDNARDAAQVASLLPGGPNCAVLVTGRRYLHGLITAHGAHAVVLGTFSADEGEQLLALHLGRHRITREPRAAAALLACCAGLPLAISVVAARAIAHPGHSLASFAEELADSAARLDALQAGDPIADVRTVLSWSHGALSPAASTVIDLVALAPGPDIGVPAAASLAACAVDRVRAVLLELESAHLLQQDTPGRYRMHDLVRLYGAERARENQPAARTALRRLVDFYIHSAHAGDRLLAPQRPPIQLTDPAADCTPYTPPDPVAALAWFDTEHSCLLAAQQLAWSLGWDAGTWQFAWALNTFHSRRGHLHDQVATWQLALTAAERLDDPASRVLAHRWLGHACAAADRIADSLDHLHRAVALAELAGDTTNQAHAHHILARAWEQNNDDHQALIHANHALRLFQTLANPVWQAQALNAVGWYSARLGRYAEARAACEAALALHREHSYKDGEAGTLDSLGYIAYVQGEHAQALDHYNLALTLYLDRGNTYAAADTLDRIGTIYRALGQPERAADAWTSSLEYYQTQNRQADADRVRKQLARL